MSLHKKHLEENYLDEIEEIFNSITGTNFTFQFKLESELLEEKIHLEPCNVCRYEPPSSLGYKPCVYCPATAKENKLKN